MLDHIRRAVAINLVRPYVSRELPGWGYLYRFFVGSFQNDRLWKGQPERWVRGKLHGYEMPLDISGWSNRGTYFLRRFYDLPTQLLVQDCLKSGDTFIDIGANEGMISLGASRAVGVAGKVISFEPNPAVREVLSRTIRLNGIGNIEVRAAGLSDEAGEMTLFVPDINSGEGTFTAVEGVAGSTVTCPVVVGDHDLDGVDPALIKIDVEGFEMRVLRGLKKTLLRAKPAISIELIDRHLARDGQSAASVVAYLRTLGYEGKRLSLTRQKTLKLGPIPDPWVDGDYLFTVY